MKKIIKKAIVILAIIILILLLYFYILPHFAEKATETLVNSINNSINAL